MSNHPIQNKFTAEMQPPAENKGATGPKTMTKMRDVNQYLQDYHGFNLLDQAVMLFQEAKTGRYLKKEILKMLMDKALPTLKSVEVQGTIGQRLIVQWSDVIPTVIDADAEEIVEDASIVEDDDTGDV